MGRQHRSLVASLGLVLGLALLPASAPAASPEAAERLLDIAGVPEMVRSLEEGLATVPEGIAAAGSELGEHWAEAARRHLRLDALRAELAAAVAAGVPDADAALLIDWYAAGLGLRVTGMEKAAQTGEGRERRLEEGGRLFAEIARTDPERLAALRALERALDAIESETAVALNLNFAMVSGMMASGKLPATLGDAEILALVRQSSPAIRAAVAQSFFATSAFTYRDLPTAELRAYAAFLAAPPARAFYAAINTTLEQAIRARMRAMGHEIMLLSGARRI